MLKQVLCVTLLCALAVSTIAEDSGNLRQEPRNLLSNRRLLSARRLGFFNTKSLTDGLKSVSKTLTDTASKLTSQFKGVVDQLPSKLQTGFKNAYDAVKGATSTQLSNLQTQMQGVMKSVGSVTKGFDMSKFNTAVSSAFRTVGGKITVNMNTMMAQVKDSLEDAKFDANAYIRDLSKTVSDKAGAVRDAVKYVGNQYATYLKDVPDWDDMTKSLGDALEDVQWGDITKAVDQAGKAAKSIGSSTAQHFDMTQVTDKIVAGLKTAVKSGKIAKTNFVKLVKPFAGKVTKDSKKFILKVMEEAGEAKDAMQGAINDLTDTNVKSMVDSVSGVIDDIDSGAAQASDFADVNFKRVMDGLDDAFAKSKNTLSTARKDVKSLLNKFGKYAKKASKEWRSNLNEAMASGLKTMARKAKWAARSKWDDVTKKLGKAAGYVDWSKISDIMDGSSTATVYRYQEDGKTVLPTSAVMTKASETDSTVVKTAVTNIEAVEAVIQEGIASAAASGDTEAQTDAQAAFDDFDASIALALAPPATSTAATTGALSLAVTAAAVAALAL